MDDDGVCLAMLGAWLRRRGYDVCAYADPAEALERLELDLPAAVITDMRMPGLSGLDVVTRVRERLREHAPPVLVVSASDEEHLLSEAFRLGATDYLIKPVNEAELAAKLGRALRPSKAEQAWGSIPSAVGPWRLGACIGRGGTAAVFEATRGDDPTRRALKVVWPHLTGSTETMLRFRREIDTLCELAHPRLVRFVESGREEGCFYYVMDLLPGGTLRGRIRREGPRPPGEVVRLLGELAAAIGYLHERGLVHRDVKPGNIYFDAEGGAVLGDLGLARRLPDRGITLSREFIGTPLYLAPEVFRSPDFDPSVDLYALGVTAYEALLGRAPLDDRDPVTLIAAILERGLPPVRETLPDLPGPLADLLERLVAPDPAERIRTGAEALDGVAAVRRTLDG